jgi:hypothetical protein
MKGLLVSILKNSEIGDCTNGGLSATATDALLVGEDVPEIFEDNGKRPVFKLVERYVFGDVLHKHVEPIYPPTKNYCGWMAGGNFVWTSDSRFPNDYPLSIHDRQELA